MYLRCRSSGFTLIELMIVLALIAIVAFVAVPNFREIVESNRQTSVTNSMLGLLNYSRSEAVRRAQPVEITSVGDGFVASIFAGGGTTVIREIESFPGDTSVGRIDASAWDLTFEASGQSNATAAARYLVCGASGRDGTVIRINRGGQISTEPATVACP